VQLRGASAPHPVIQRDQLVGQWVQALSHGVSSFSSAPAAKQAAFIAEARGTCHTGESGQVPQCIVDASASSSEPPVQASGASAEFKSKRPLFKLEKYDGNSSLETYLLQFKHLATYLQWGEEDKFFNMCASLDGPAAQVLWELPPNSMTAELERLLQTRFGTEKQTSSFQAKLRAWRRAEGEPLQDLYREVRRLVQLPSPVKAVGLCRM